EVLVESATERRGQVRVTVDQAGDECLPLSPVDLRVRILLQDRVGRTDRRDRVAVDGERRVVLHRVHGHNGGVREDDGSARRRLGIEIALRKPERGGTGSCAGEQLTPTETASAARGLRTVGGSMNRWFPHDSTCSKI